MRIVTLLIALGVLSIGFGLVERFWPSIGAQRRLRPGLLTDLAYYAFTPTLGKAFTGIIVFVSVLAVARIASVPLTASELRGLTPRDTAISHQPIGLQMIEFFVLADFLAYWSHRSFHTFGRLWRMHAVHHSSTQLDWLSSVRVHPLNDALTSVIVATPLLLLGFSVGTLAAYTPFLTLYAILLHANVSWRMGPLRQVIATPFFHRWHHSVEDAALNKNFGGLFLIWDRAFGTLYLPDSAPARFGVRDDQVPASFFSQLVYPLRRAKTAAPGSIAA